MTPLSGLKAAVSRLFYKETAVGLFFIAYLLVGAGLYMDYGLSWDDETNRIFGELSLRYVINVLNGGQVGFIEYATRPGTQRMPQLLHHAKTHGPVVDMLMQVLQKALGLTDSRDIFFVRHFATFVLFYIGVFFFYKLCSYRFNSWKTGLLGALFLVMSPRIFASAFYDQRDISFLVLTVISTYTLVRFLDETTLATAVHHAIACALLMGIRPVGVMAPGITLLFASLEYLRFRQKKTLIGLSAYTILVVLFTIAFWPFLWENPADIFIDGFTQTTRFEYRIISLYMGEYVGYDGVPWHYNLVWMAVTIPPLYILCFIAGLIAIARSFLKNPAGFSHANRNDLIPLLWLFIPLSVPIALGTTLFNGWRHHYFIYPAFLLISLTGLTYMFEAVKRRFRGPALKAMNAALVLVIAFSLASTAFFICTSHPHEEMYFNVLAGSDMRLVGENFEMDYWGVSYRKALEFVVENDSDKQVKVGVNEPPGIYNSFILPPEDRERLLFVKDPAKAEYFIGRFLPSGREHLFKGIHSVKSGEAVLCAVYRVVNYSSVRSMNTVSSAPSTLPSSMQ